jgi:hypothetical protein
MRRRKVAIGNLSTQSLSLTDHGGDPWRSKWCVIFGLDAGTRWKQPRRLSPSLLLPDHRGYDEFMTSTADRLIVPIGKEGLQGMLEQVQA